MKTKNVFLIILSAFFISCAELPKNDEEKQVETLLSKMTLEEKIGQLNQLSFIEQEDLQPQIIEAIKEGKIGSLLNVVDPIKVNELQRAALEGSRMGIPLIIGRDVIHGFKTIFPIPIGQAATFNPEIVREGAAVAAAEARSVGVNWTFSPMLDISRDPRWGRLAEGCGEDPYLAAIMGEAFVKGYQGNSLADKTSIAACIKHFVAYGAAEGGRDYNSTNIPDHLMHNVYLVPFKKAVEAGAATLMTSFNDNDGIPASANEYLLRDVLRKDWGFDGFVVSDWASITEMIAHGSVADAKEAAMKSINAGVDMEMVSMSYITYLPELLKEGKVSEKTIDDAVRNILRIKIRLGLFENPYVDTEEPSILYAEEHLKKAKIAAEQSAILLKNNGLLPLGENIKTLAVVGPLADAPHDQLGTWIFDGEKEHSVTPLAALKEMYGDKVKIVFEPALAYSRDKNKSNFANAMQLARSSDAVLAIVGEESILSGEAHSLADISLKGAQKELIAELKKTGKPLVVVVMAGRPLTIEDELNASDAMLYYFHPGTMGGPALADLLFGKAVPSGKLPMTFPKHVGQIPLYYGHNNTGRPAQKTETLIDDIPLEAGQTSLGNTSYYLDAGFDPLFPFGYGLSYTSFEYSDLRLSTTSIAQNENIDVTVTLKNTGKYDAAEVVQLYVRDLVGSIARPVKELKGFQRINLKAGESQEVSFSLSSNDLAFYGLNKKFITEAGEFKIWVGGDSASGLEASFSLK